MQTARRTMITISLIAIGIAMLGTFMGSPSRISIAAGSEGFARLSPFTDVRYEADDSVSVEYNGQWYELVSIDDTMTALLLQTARESFGQLWQKRFAEDLVEVMEAADQRPRSTVKLVLGDRRSEQLLTIDQAPMTAENRQQLYRNYRRWLTDARNPGSAMSGIEDGNAQRADESVPLTDVLDGRFHVTWTARTSGSQSTKHSVSSIKSIRIRKRIIMLLKSDGGGYLIPTDALLELAWLPAEGISLTTTRAEYSDDQERIQGTWRIVSAGFSGRTD